MPARGRVLETAHDICFVKLATALIGISSIHLLKTFIEAERVPQPVIYSQIALHMTFVFSALLLAFTDRTLALAAGKVHNAKTES